MSCGPCRVHASFEHPDFSAVKSPATFFRHKGFLLAIGLLIGFGTGRYAGLGSDDAGHNGVAGNPAGSRGSEPGGMAGNTSRKEAGAGRTKGETREFGESVRSVFRETIKERRVAQFEKLLERVDVTQFEAMVSLIRENDLLGNDTGEEWTRLWQAWGQRDPAGAFEFINQQDWTGWDPAALGEARNRALISWAQTDPEQARRHVEEGPELASGDRSQVYQLVRGWSEVDPDGAVAWLAKTGLGKSKEYDALVEAISRRDGAEGLNTWFSERMREGTSEQDKNGFAQAIAKLKQEYEPEKAAAWVEQHLGEDWLPESEIVESTAHAFAARDPEGAMQWAAKTGIGNATMAAMNSWCQRDLAAASAWMIRNIGDPAYAASAPVVLDFLSRTDPASARTWAESLPDPATRDRLLQQMGE